MLPGVLKEFNVCLVPFKINKFNAATNPIKFWEYLAAGKRILSSRIPELEPYSNVVELYETKEEAVVKLSHLLDSSLVDDPAERLSVAARNDLTVCSMKYLDALNVQLSNRLEK